MKRILLDCDGPLTDFDASATQFLKDQGYVSADWKPPFGVWKLQDALPLDTGFQLEKHIRSPGFVTNMEAVEGAQQAFFRLQQVYLAEVLVVTAPYFKSLHWPGERIVWLKQFGFSEDQIVLTAAKHVVIGDILVDDKPENLIAWKQYHPQGTAILWRTRGNFHHWEDSRFIQMDGWKDPLFWTEVVR